jgi:hypothetical protein
VPPAAGSGGAAWQQRSLSGTSVSSPRAGIAEDHGDPEPDEGVQGPHALPLDLPDAAEGSVAERGRDVLLQQVDEPQQVDGAASGHSTCQRWGYYEPVNATPRDLPASYLYGDGR